MYHPFHDCHYWQSFIIIFRFFSSNIKHHHHHHHHHHFMGHPGSSYLIIDICLLFSFIIIYRQMSLFLLIFHFVSFVIMNRTIIFYDCHSFIMSFPKSFCLLPFCILQYYKLSWNPLDVSYLSNPSSLIGLSKPNFKEHLLPREF